VLEPRSEEAKTVERGNKLLISLFQGRAAKMGLGKKMGEPLAAQSDHALQRGGKEKRGVAGQGRNRLGGGVRGKRA